MSSQRPGRNGSLPFGRDRLGNLYRRSPLACPGIQKGTRFAGVEMGGMSIRVAIAEDTPENIVDRQTFKTRTPAVTIPEIVEWLEQHQPFAAMGIASFGPIDPRPGSKTFGYITSTPKVEWRNFDLYGALDRFGVPILFDTDVNAPAMFEYLHAKQYENPQISSCAYITVGTGVGVGLVVNGRPVHGLLHPEAGHIPYPRPEGDTFGGLAGHAIRDGCEANVSAPALAERAGLDSPAGLADLPDSHPVWKAAAHYLAGVCVSIVLLASAEKIVIGGGVLNRKCLYPMIRSEVQRVLNGYIQVEAITTDNINEYIVPAIHGNDAGIIGTLALAESALANPDLGEPPAAVSPVVPSAADSAAQGRGAGRVYINAVLVGVLAAVVLHRLLPKL